VEYYRALLQRYMAHVVNIEGANFIDSSGPDGSTLSENDKFELGLIASELATKSKEPGNGD